MHALLLALALTTPTAARVVTPQELTLLYPDFNRVHYRFAGHRIGWTQAKAWPHKAGWQALLVERLEGEGDKAPRSYEAALTDGTQIIARGVGFAGHVSPGEESSAPHMVGLDLGAFELREGTFALGVKTTDGGTQMLTLLMPEGAVLTPVLSIPMEAPGGDNSLVRSTLTLLRKKGDASADRDILVKRFEVQAGEAGAASGKLVGETRYRRDGNRYVETQTAVKPTAVSAPARAVSAPAPSGPLRAPVRIDPNTP